MLTQRAIDTSAQTISATTWPWRMPSQCLGCKDCSGICAELQEMWTFPEVVLSKG